MKYIFIFLILFTKLAMAIEGDRVGNGGDILICQEPAGEKVYVLDEYEGKLDLIIGDDSLDYREKVLLLIERMRKSFPLRYQYYLHAFGEYERNVTYYPTKLPQVDDTGITPPQYCDMVQAALFTKGIYNRNNYYLQKSVWDILNENQKAVLIFHELVYTEATGLGHKNSLYVRQANRAIFRNEDFNAVVYDEILIAPIRNIPVSIKTYSGQLQSAYSEGIALYLLNKDIKDLYRERALKDSLENLKIRFAYNEKVIKLIDQHLNRIAEI